MSPLTVGTPDKIAKCASAGLPTQNWKLGYVVRGPCPTKVRLCPPSQLARLLFTRWRTAHRQGYQLKIFRRGLLPPILGGANLQPPFLNFGPEGIALKLPVVVPLLLMYIRGPGSSVGIAIELRSGRSGIESRWGREFPHVQTGPGTHPVSYTMGTLPLPGGNCGRGVLLTNLPLLVCRSWKSRSIALPTLWAKPVF